MLALAAASPRRAFARDAAIDQQVRQWKAMQQELMLGGASRELDEMRALAKRLKGRKPFTGSKGLRSEPPRDHQEALGAQGMEGASTGMGSRTAAQPRNQPIAPTSPAFTTQSEVSVAGARGGLLAVWNDGARHQGQLNAISFATSTDGGQTWREGGPLPVGGQIAVWVSDPVAAVDAARGDFYVAGLAITSTANNGVGIVRGHFASNSFTWETPRAARSVRDSLPDKPWLAADSLTGNLYMSYTTFYKREGKNTDRIEFQRSVDGGQTWSPAFRISPASEEGLVQGSRPAIGPDGKLHVVWKTIDTTAAAGGLDAMRISSSADHGATFGDVVTVAGLFTNFCSGPPGFDRGFGLGFPSIAVDRSSGPHRGRIHVAWEESLDFYDDPLPLSPMRNETEPNNRTLDATPFTVGEAVRGAITPIFDMDWFRFHGDAGRTVVLALDSLDARLDVALRLWCGDGTTRLAYSTSVNVRQRVVLYTLPKAGDYYVSIAPQNDSTGAYRLVSGWAARGAERGRDQRDIFVAHSDDGISWSTPALATDAPSGFDDWLPELAVDANGKPFVAWYDYREGDPAQCGAASHVRLSRSDDGGDHWVPVGLVTEEPTLWSGVFSNQSPNMGDYIALLADAEGILPAWADGRSADPDVYSAFWITADAARTITPLASQPQSGGVVVRWLAPPPLPVIAAIYRRISGGSAEPIGETEPDAQGVLSFLDVDLQPGYRYHYELAVRSSDGEIRVGAQSIDAPGAGAGPLAIERVAPNPSDGAFRIQFRRPNLSPARMDVLDVSGRRVLGVNLSEEYGTRGVLDFGSQTRLDAGLYLVRLVQAGSSVSVKAVVVR